MNGHNVAVLFGCSEICVSFDLEIGKFGSLRPKARRVQTPILPASPVFTATIS